MNLPNLDPLQNTDDSPEAGNFDAPENPPPVDDNDWAQMPMQGKPNQKPEDMLGNTLNEIGSSENHNTKVADLVADSAMRASLTKNVSGVSEKTARTKRPWSNQEDEQLTQLINNMGGARQWKKISQEMVNRTDQQCM